MEEIERSLNDNGWQILYYNLTIDNLSDPDVKQHLPENGKCYEVELFTHTDQDNFTFKGTCFARYQEHFTPYGTTGLLVKNTSKWFETMPNGEEREVTDTVLRFREIQ